MRHYCDFCKKSTGTKPSMVKHEKGCTLNPGRECRLCELAGHVQQPMAQLIDVLADEGFEALQRATQDCPCCMLAALRQIPVERDAVLWDEEDAKTRGRSAWQFKEACKDWWSDYNDSQQSSRYY